MTPPDSDAREVCGAQYTRDGKLLVCQEPPHHDVDHSMQVADRRRDDSREVACDAKMTTWCPVHGALIKPDRIHGGSVSLPLPLAQRILAALESHPGEAEYGLAAELRALVTK